MQLLALFTASLLALASPVLSQTVTTLNGTIKGARCSTTNVNYFYSIPFAQAPVGDLRFAAPKPYNGSFDGELDGTRATPSCMQFGSGFAQYGPKSEDCLFVNVWAPANATTASKLPVKVWLYGGTNEAGGVSNPTYSGCFGATESIIVSINYRLGPLGFLAVSSLGLSGNYGHLDQVLGLEWVQENIEAFGGDPTKVLLFGQSAGAYDTFALATLSNAPDLMSAAAMESGGGRDYPTMAQVQSGQTEFVKLTNCSATDLSCLRGLPASAFQDAFNAYPSTGLPQAQTLLSLKNGSWGPVVDGQVIPTQPVSAGVQVPSIFGTNAQDASLFLLEIYTTNIESLDESDYDEFLAYNFGSLASSVNASAPVSLWASEGSLAVYAAILEVYNMYAFVCPAYRGLKGAADNGVSAWTYRFSHTPSCPWYSDMATLSAYLPFMAATHTAEIPFVFNHTQHMPPPNGTCSFSSSEVQLAADMSQAWTMMAAEGRPGDEAAWPAWTADATMGVNITEALNVVALNFSLCSTFWDSIDAGVFAQAQPNSTTLNSASSSNSRASAVASGGDSLAVTAASSRPAVFALLALASLLVL